jgi:Zn-dependent peptidase ImmA (M78 family)
MGIDLIALSKKLIRYRENFLLSSEDLSSKSGIDINRLNLIESGTIEPSGDEILILADIYHCDYNYFISNQAEPLIDKIEPLFRKHSKDLSVNDRWAIQESIFLAENEAFLDAKLGTTPIIPFEFKPKGNFHKGHGHDAAIQLRKLLYPSNNRLNLNIYSDFRKIGINIFRRALENTDISGIFLNHPSIGKFILINYSEDIFRQRFTTAHEAGHAIFDSDDADNGITFFSRWDKKDLKEIRANVFASEYLVPKELLDTIQDNKYWSSEKLIEWALKFKVNIKPLLIALKENKLINDIYYETFKGVFVPDAMKIDPELKDLSPFSLERMQYLFKNGLTHEYVIKCYKAYDKGIISISKMAELLLVDLNGLYEINELFKLGIEYAN